MKISGYLHVSFGEKRLHCKLDRVSLDKGVGNTHSCYFVKITTTGTKYSTYNADLELGSGQAIDMHVHSQSFCTAIK